MPVMPSNQARTFIPLFRPEVAGSEWAYVKDCLDTGWLSSAGAYVDRFEAAVAARAGSRHAVATASGTAALHIALLVAGVEPDDEVVVPNLTFIAPANAVRYVGAHPVFIDADPACWQMDVRHLEEFLIRRCRWTGGVLRNAATARRVRAILPVHVLGHPCDMDAITELARRHELPVIEDASESLGAEYRGRAVGQLGAIACFSFNGNKIVTSGAGGMVTTDNEQWARRARYLTTQAKDDPIEYVHHAIGYNYRLSNVNAALGLAQMEQLDGFLRRKREIAAAYTQAFAGCAGVTSQSVADWASPSWWLYTIAIDARLAGIDSRTLLARLAAADIETRPLWHPIASLPPYEGAQTIGDGVAERLYRTALSLPSSSTLSPEQQQRVIDAVRDGLAG